MACMNDLPNITSSNCREREVKYLTNIHYFISYIVSLFKGFSIRHEVFIQVYVEDSRSYFNHEYINKKVECSFSILKIEQLSDKTDYTRVNPFDTKFYFKSITITFENDHFKHCYITEESEAGSISGVTSFSNEEKKLNIPIEYFEKQLSRKLSIKPIQ